MSRSLLVSLGILLFALSGTLVLVIGPGKAWWAPQQSHAVAQSAAPTGNDPSLAQRPLLAVVGASVAAGVGAGTPANAWPQVLARRLHWRVVVSAESGAGYLNPGNGDQGPFTRLAARLDLPRRHPAVVLIQGGHNDIGQPQSVLAQRVRDLVTTIHQQAPNAKLGVLTVFNTGRQPSLAALETDRTIVAAAKQADPQVMVFDPLAAHWQYPRIGDELHPTAAGHRYIADQLAAALERDGAVGCPIGSHHAFSASAATHPLCGSAQA